MKDIKNAIIFKHYGIGDVMKELLQQFADKFFIG